MKPFYITLFGVFLSLTASVSAQTIRINFPYFSGEEYAFVLYQGTVTDTIQKGVVGKDGQVTISIPENKKGYVGMGSWLPGNAANFPLVIGKEDFSMICNDTVPRKGAIIFEGSPENELLLKNNQLVQAFFQQIQLALQTKDTKKKDFVSLGYEQQIAGIRKEIEVYQKSLGENKSSYAAFYTKIFNLLSHGLGERLYESKEEASAYAQSYFSDELDMEKLYTSGLWNHLISFSFDLFADKVQWGDAMIKALRRTYSQLVFEAFANDLVVICEQFGWQDAEENIVTYLEASGRIPEPKGMMLSAFLINKVKVGHKAPAIEGQDLSNVLLIFYSSGCENCIEQLNQLTNNYSRLQEKGIRIISLSTDEDKAVYEYHSRKFPWPNKLCDFQGFSGVNFKNYGIMGTPTLFLVDKDGMIVDRQARYEDIKRLNP
jgi:peroxiredoxin